MYGLQAEAHFDAAHFLTNYHGKCENLHGHRWRVVATIEVEELQGAEAGGHLRDDGTSGADGTERDMVVDFGVFKRVVGEVALELDHTFLVEEGSLSPATVAALEAEGFTLTVLPFRTTAENLARHVFDRLAERGLPVSQVEVDETPNNRAFYAPEGHVGR
jgi:6-pyruvoyltetrahydropterin/6-carboxytetrahydropterin synthase